MELTLKQVKGSIGIEGFNVKVKILGIYDRKTGKGEYGDWSLQNLLVQDETDKLYLVLCNRPEMPQDYKGKEILIKSTLNSKNKLVGVKTVEEEYKGNKTIKLKVDNRAEIIDEDTSFVPFNEPLTEEKLQETMDMTDTKDEEKLTKISLLQLIDEQLDYWTIKRESLKKL